MNTPPIDLEFLPDWARHPASAQSFPERGTGGARPPRRGTERHEPRGERRPERRPERRGPPSKDRKREPFRKAEAPRPPPAPLPIEVYFQPEPNALESVIDQVRASARAYPLFSIARMFLEKPERHLVQFQVAKNATLKLYQCKICQNLAFEKSTLIQHLMHRHRDAFYKEERQQGEPMKGNFTSVARCSLNGALIAPSNHHSYQTRLVQLYKAQFSRMPFERFKESIVQVRDPEVVKKWLDESAWKSTFVTLQTTEPQTLNSSGDLERHFLENHLAASMEEGSSFTVSGEASRTLDQSALVAAVRQAWETESRFPARFGHKLRELFFKNNLHIFKGKKGIQFVCLVRPKPLVMDSVLISPGVKIVLDYIEAHPGCTRKALVDALAPEASATPEARNILLQDLHWLVRQGHILEYNNGTLEITRPPKKKETKPSPVAEPAPSPDTPPPPAS